MLLPLRLNTAPLLEAITEIRFSPIVPADAVLGILLSKLESSAIENVETLPSAQIPSPIRQQDINLKFTATHKIKLKGYPVYLLIGPYVIAISNSEPYIGWNSLRLLTIDLINRMELNKITTEWSGFSMRYINFFPNDIFDCSTLTTSIHNEPVHGKKIFTNTFDADNFQASYTLTNNATLIQQNKIGSILDISLRDDNNKSILNTQNLDKLLDDSHTHIKNIFFKLLRDDFIKKLGPEFPQ